MIGENGLYYYRLTESGRTVWFPTYLMKLLPYVSDFDVPFLFLNYKKLLVIDKLEFTFISADNAKKTVNDSIKHIEQLTCVRFVKRTTQTNYINITKGSG